MELKEMQILTTYSAVALEDRQAIEQLIFTARELASTAARTAGFENTIEGNQRLGLEMWEGAAYTCRQSEEVTIKNIFLCNFLERLRDIARTAPPVPVAAGLTRPVSEPNAGPGADPGASPSVISNIPAEQPANISRPSYADECVPEFEREGAEEVIAGSTEDGDGAVVENTPDQLPESKVSDASEVPVVDATPDPDSKPSEVNSGSAIEAGVPGVGSIVISENEPFRFESCTVTLVMQLLAVEDGYRKSIVSVRTHDFTPHIEIASVNENLPAGELAAMISSAVEKYRNELPVRAADKLKRQAAAGKKASAKPAASPNPSDQKAAPADAKKGADLGVATSGSQQAGLFGG